LRICVCELHEGGTAHTEGAGGGLLGGELGDLGDHELRADERVRDRVDDRVEVKGDRDTAGAAQSVEAEVDPFLHQSHRSSIARER
jgi:hypothetical protein